MLANLHANRSDRHTGTKFPSKICLSSKKPFDRLLTQRVGGVNQGIWEQSEKELQLLQKQKRSDAIRSAGLINKHIDSTAMLGF